MAAARGLGVAGVAGVAGTRAAGARGVRGGRARRTRGGRARAAGGAGAGGAAPGEGKAGAAEEGADEADAKDKDGAKKKPAFESDFDLSETPIPVDDRGDKHAILYDFAIGLPYGAAVLAISVHTENILLSVLGGFSAYVASLCVKAWKRSPILTRGYTLAQIALTGGTALWCARMWQAARGTATSWFSSYPWEPVAWLAAAACAYHVYVIFSGGNPPHKYDRLGVNFKPTKEDLEEEYALDW